MLVLSRKKNESVLIGYEHKVLVVDIRGDKVRLGFDCPTDVPVHREEVFHAIARANKREGVALSKEQTSDLVKEIENLVIGLIHQKGFHSSNAVFCIERSAKAIAERIVLAC